MWNREPGQIGAVSAAPPDMRGAHNCLKRLGRLPRFPDAEINWSFLICVRLRLWLTWCPRHECFRPMRRRQATEAPLCSNASRRPGNRWHIDMLTRRHSGMLSNDIVTWWKTFRGHLASVAFDWFIHYKVTLRPLVNLHLTNTYQVTTYFVKM